MKKLIARIVAAIMIVGAFGTLAGCSTPQEPGRVYYLNCVAEANETWQKLASAYSDLYGVEVTVRTVSAEDYTASLLTQLQSGNAPTVFQFHHAADLQRLQAHCLDLTGSAVLEQTACEAFNLTSPDGTVDAIGYSYDAFGIVVNTALLEQAGYDLDGIFDFASLKQVAEDIHSRAPELGFDAFAVPGLETSSSWRFAGELAGIARYYELRDRISGECLRDLRNSWELYVNNSSVEAAFLLSTTAKMSLDEFAAGKAVFCQYNASAYDALIAEPYRMDPSALAMLPVYFGTDTAERAALSCTVQGYWAVNSGASEADRKATLDFLNWVVTSEYGAGVMAEQFGGVPFQAAINTQQGFFSDAGRYISEEKDVILSDTGENWQAVLTGALAAYAANQTEDNWKKVEEAFYKDPTA